jgi:hypothetical protein
MRRTFGVAVGVAVGDGRAVAVAVAVAVTAVGDGDGLAVGVTVPVGLAVGVVVPVGAGASVAVGVGVGTAAKAPLAITPPIVTTSRKAIAVPIAHCRSRLLLGTLPFIGPPASGWRVRPRAAGVISIAAPC